MSKPGWARNLTQTLSRLRRDNRPPRIAIVGLGHNLCGDDAAGVVVAQALQAQMKPNPPNGLLIIDAGPAPENFTGPLRRFVPDLVLLIDAAQLDEAPGAVRWLPWTAAAGLSASTHTLSPYLLARYLTLELECEVVLLGIQPARLVGDGPLSPQVRRAVGEVVEILGHILLGENR